MFIQMEGALPAAAALPILTAQAPSLCAPFLEAVLANGTASPREHHNDLAGIYLRILLNGAADSGARWIPSERLSLYKFGRALVKWREYTAVQTHHRFQQCGLDSFHWLALH